LKVNAFGKAPMKTLTLQKEKKEISPQQRKAKGLLPS